MPVEEPESLRDIGRRVVRGFAWLGASRAVQQSLRLIRTMLLARLLIPSDFGLVGMVGFFTGLVGVLAELGIPSAVIRHKNLDSRMLSSLFWFLIGLGIIFSSISAALSSFVGRIFNENSLPPFVMVASIGILLAATKVLPLSLLNREMRFDKLLIPDFIAVSTLTVVSIGLAWKGFRAWSIIYASVISMLLSALVAWRLHPFRPIFHFSFSEIRGIVAFGVPLVGAGFLDYLSSNLDFFFVGAMLGSQSLGLYTIAFNLVSYPQTKLAALVNSAMFPAFARLQDRKEDFSKATVTVVSFLLLAVVPFIAGLWATADLFLPVMLGKGWNAAVKPVCILCLGAPALAVASTLRAAVVARGRSDIELKLSGLKFLVLAPLFPTAIRWGGLVAVSWLMVFHAWLLLLGQMYFLRKAAGLGFSRLFSAMLRPLALNAVMVVMVTGLRLFCRGRMSTGAELFFCVAFGAASYFLMIYLLEKEFVDKCRMLITPGSSLDRAQA